MTATTLSACVFLMVWPKRHAGGPVQHVDCSGAAGVFQGRPGRDGGLITRLHGNPIEPERLPVRVVVTDSGERHVDGSGYGLYADGRFYADGGFQVVVPPGDTQFDLRSGPNYVPLQFAVAAETGSRVKSGGADVRSGSIRPH